MSSAILLAPLLVSFTTGLLCIVFLRGNQTTLKVISLMGALVHLLITSLILFAVQKADVISIQLGGWNAPFGISVVVDYLSALMLIVTSVLYLAGVIFSFVEDIPIPYKPYFWALMHFLIMGVSGAFSAGDYFNLYVCYEIMIIASFGLMAISENQLTLEGTFKYALLNFLASTLFLMGLGILYGVVGSLNIADVTHKITTSEHSVWALSAALLITIGFSIKSALFPFYSWLPSSYHLPTFSASAIFAGLLTKVGLYSLFRLLLMSFQSHQDIITPVFVFIACMTMLLGAFGAATKFHMRKILSFHIISQVGYIVLAIAFFTQAAVTAAIFYMAHHMIVKSNLFLISGAVKKITGHEDLSGTGGLLRSHPELAFAFAVSGFSLGGIPPLSGFFAKLGILREGIHLQSYAVVFVGLFVGILTLYSMVKIWAEVFWKEPIEKNMARKKIPLLMLIPIIFLCCITLFLSFKPGLLMNFSNKAAALLLDPKTYIQTVLPMK